MNIHTYENIQKENTFFDNRKMKRKVDLIWSVILNECITTTVFTLHVPVFFWPSKNNFRDIEQKFSIFLQLPYH